MGCSLLSSALGDAEMSGAGVWVSSGVWLSATEGKHKSRGVGACAAAVWMKTARSTAKVLIHMVREEEEGRGREEKKKLFGLAGSNRAFCGECGRWRVWKGWG